MAQTPMIRRWRIAFPQAATVPQTMRMFTACPPEPPNVVPENGCTLTTQDCPSSLGLDPVTWMFALKIATTPPSTFLPAGHGGEKEPVEAVDCTIPPKNTTW